jgi:SAM-dependent methyltransferase
MIDASSALGDTEGGAVPAACPVCGAVAPRPVAGSRGRWRYHRCAVCAHTMLWPHPTTDDLASFYNSAYAVPLEAHLERARKELPPLRRVIGPARGHMLEIGCSYGGFLAGFRDDGWTVQRIELDERACAHARRTFGLDVVAGTLEDGVRTGLARPDVVTAYHVLEHVVDPSAFLRTIATLLPIGGRLIMQTPNGASLPARRLGMVAVVLGPRARARLQPRKPAGGARGGGVRRGADALPAGRGRGHVLRAAPGGRETGPAAAAGGRRRGAVRAARAPAARARPAGPGPAPDRGGDPAPRRPALPRAGPLGGPSWWWRACAADVNRR